MKKLKVSELCQKVHFGKFLGDCAQYGTSKTFETLTSTSNFLKRK